jgi:hypothetical protein
VALLPHVFTQFTGFQPAYDAETPNFFLHSMAFLLFRFQAQKYWYALVMLIRRVVTSAAQPFLPGGVMPARHDIGAHVDSDVYALARALGQRFGYRRELACTSVYLRYCRHGSN